jgi:hypothetical protein
MVVAPPASDDVVPASGSLEIITGSVTIRLEAGVSAERIAAIVRALAVSA